MPEGHLPVVSYLAVPVISSSGKVIGGLFFGHREPGVFTKEHEDLVVGIASQSAVAIDNAKLYEEVKTLNAKKDEFIGLASHELKTPLTSINGYLQLLERHQTTELNKNFVKKTVQQVGKLTALVSDLLDVSKIEAGKLQFSKERFDIKALIFDVVDIMQLATDNHQIAFDLEPTSVLVYADKQRIEQVIINLLTNAIKYSPKAKKIALSLQETNKEVIVSVQDFGIGIHPEKLNHIFSRFYRVDDLSPHMSGLGIGLYISREIIERHNGKIGVSSEVGKGSTFYFTLPKEIN
jgi:signal transduction histidine kinase